MIKKLAYAGVVALLISSIISCEKDFEDIGTNVISNNAFETGVETVDIQISQEDISSVRADNIALGTLGEYWLGVYNKPNYKKIEASIVSQVGYLNNLSSKETDGDTIFSLNRVVLKLPYQAVSLGKNSEGINTFRLDSILGSGPTSIKVYRNDTYLNSLNPTNPSQQNEYQSNVNYLKEATTGILNEDENFKFEPKATDTIFITDIKRNNVIIGKDTIVNSSNKINAPFLAIPLNVAKMKALFWDEFNGSKFASKDAFDNYFRGLIIEAEGENGSLVPLKLTASSTLEFLYSKNVVRSNNVDTVIKKRHTFPLSGIRNSVYKMSSSSSMPNSITIQGTAGKTAKINLFSGTQLQDLRAKKWLINDASLTFYVNQTIDQDTAIVPQRLFLYKNLQTSSGSILPVQISDAYREAKFFGGNLGNANKKPEKYTIRITDYISKILKGDEPTSPLTLRVYNPTDVAVSNNVLDTIVKAYNWNPRGVTLLDNSSTNGDKKAVLKITYTKEK